VLAAVAVLPLVAAGQAQGAQASRVPPPVEITPTMRKQAQEAQAQNAGRTVFRLSPDGRALRDRSRRRYGNLSRSEAVGLAHGEFGDVFGGPIWRLPRLPSGFAVDEFVSDNQFYVKTGHGRERQLLMSTLPSSAVNDQGDRELVSTDLARAGDQLVPENSAAPVAIAEQASGGIGFEGTGVHVDLVGATASGATVEGDKAIFPDALLDADYTVAALPTGAETFLQLRTADAPEEARFRFAVPAGGELQLTGNPIGAANAQVGARVVKDGQTVLKIAPPNARDADGRPVPVHYAIDGNDLILKIDHRGGDFLYPILVDPQYVIDRMGSTGNPVFGFWRSMNGFDPYDCTWNPYCDTGTGLGGPGLYINARPQGYPTDWSGYAQWYYQAPRGSSIMRVDWNGWGHTGTASCIYGRITGQYGDLQAGQLNQCETVYGNGYTPIFAYNPTPGNWARFLQFQYNGTFVGDWTKVRDPMISLWEGMSPYFQSLRPVDATQWDESARSTRWLKGGEVFQYRYNVHDDGLGLDWVDENNFGRGSRAVSTGACDFPVQSCAYDYVMPENSSTWGANETSTFPEGITSNWARAFDNVGNQGCCYNWTIRVDRSAPELAIGGDLAGLNKQTVDVSAPPLLTLTADATDGSTASDATKRSGVNAIDIELLDEDTNTVKNLDRKVQPAPCDNSCPLSHKWIFDPARWGPGNYKFRVTAGDRAGNQTPPKVITVTFTRNNTATVPEKPTDPDDGGAQLDDGAPMTEFCHSDSEITGGGDCSAPANPSDDEIVGEAPLAPADSTGAPKITPGSSNWGFADNDGQTLVDPRFTALGIKRVRVLVPWDAAYRYNTSRTYGVYRPDGSKKDYRIDPYRGSLLNALKFLRNARNNGQEVVVSIETSYMDGRDANDNVKNMRDVMVPSPTGQYRPAVEMLINALNHPESVDQGPVTAEERKLLPAGTFDPVPDTQYVKRFTAWNEPNEPSRPTSGKSAFPQLSAADARAKGARFAGQYWSELRSYCLVQTPRCSVIAGDFAENSILNQDYFDNYVSKLTRPPSVWAFHPYVYGASGDATQFKRFLKRTSPNSDYTRVGPPVWITEVGPRYHKIGINNEAQGATDMQRLIDLAKTSPRVKRFYRYEWIGGPSFDAGTVNYAKENQAANSWGNLREDYCTYAKVVAPARYPADFANRCR
jgi:hypothetical protein